MEDLAGAVTGREAPHCPALQNVYGQKTAVTGRAEAVLFTACVASTPTLLVK